MKSCRVLGLMLVLSSPALAVEPATGPISVHKRLRVEEGDTYVVREKVEKWEPNQTAIIVCDMWDAHHYLNAVRRVEDRAPRGRGADGEARRRSEAVNSQSITTRACPLPPGGWCTACQDDDPTPITGDNGGPAIRAR